MNLGHGGIIRELAEAFRVDVSGSDLILKDCLTEPLISSHSQSPDMTDERFVTAFVAMSPDADPAKHRSVIETPLYRLISVLVKDESEAVKVCGDLIKKEGVSSFILCPGFTNKGIGKLSEVLGPGISINVARGDGPSNSVTRKEMERAGFFKK